MHDGRLAASLRLCVLAWVLVCLCECVVLDFQIHHSAAGAANGGWRM